MTKMELRALIRGKKKAMTSADIADRSQKLCRLVMDTDTYRQAKTVYGYLPFNQEVDILPLLRQALLDGKLVAVPKCDGPQMRFILTDDLSRVRPTPMGVPEPMEDGPIADDKTALVIVPGLAFDRRGYRIGYGGGYYDRFLAAEPNHPTLSLCYDFQLLDALEPEVHDLPVDQVIAL